MVKKNQTHFEELKKNNLRFFAIFQHYLSFIEFWLNCQQPKGPSIININSEVKGGGIQKME